MFHNQRPTPPRRSQQANRRVYSYNPAHSSYTPPGRNRSTPGLVVPVIAFLAVGFAAYFGWQKIVKPLWAEKPTESTTTQANMQADAEPYVIPEPVIPTTSKVDMDATINAVIAANGNLNIGVAVVDLHNDELSQYGDSQPFLAASTAKVLTATHVLHLIEAGGMTLSQTIGGKSVATHLKLMIEQSDNASWKALDGYTTYPALQAYAKSIGMADYNANQNSMSTASMALLLQKLHRRELINETHTAILFEHMKNANRTDLQLPELPADATVYHKAGWLDDRTHDAAIIISENTPYVLVVYAKGLSSADLTQRINAIRAITAATVDHFISTDAIPRSVTTTTETPPATP